MKQIFFVRTGKTENAANGFLLVVGSIGTCIFLTLMLFALTVSYILRPLLRNQAVQNAEYSMSVIENELIDMQKSARNTAAYIQLIEPCAALLNAFSHEALTSTVITNGLRQMRLFAVSNSRIDSISIINRKTGYIFSTQQTPIISDSAMGNGDVFPEWLDEEKIGTFFKRTIKVNENSSSPVLRNVYTYVAPNLLQNDVMQNAVVVNLSLEYLYEKAEELFDLNTSSLLIADEQDMIFQADCLGILDDKSNAALHEMLQEGRQTQERTVNGERYLFICYDSDISDVRMISVYKYSMLYHTVYQIQHIIMGIFFVVLLLGAVLALGVAVFINIKMKRRDTAKEALADQLKSNIVYMRQKFWHEYLSQKKQYTDEELTDRVHELRLDDMQEGSLALLHLELGELTDPAAVHSVEEKMVNAFLKTFQRLAPVLMFSYCEDHLFLLRQSEANMLDSIADMSAQLVHESVCRFEVMVTGVVSQIEEYPQVWRQLGIAVPQLFFYPFDSCQQLSVVLKEHEDSVIKSNPTILQKITLAVANGDGAAAIALFEQYESSLGTKTYDCYLNCMIQVVLNVVNLLQQTQLINLKDIHPDLAFDVFCSTLRKSRKAFLLRGLVEKYILDSVSYIAEEAKQPAQCKADQICEYVQQNYADPQLTIFEIAEKFRISPDHLRKTFKDSMGKSLSQYIVCVRLTHAAEMICESERSFGEIAVDCGYLNVNYFYTRFKKYYGVTPKEYRTIHTAADSEN